MRMKKLRPEDKLIIEALRDRVLLTIQFFENTQDFPSGAQILGVVEDAVARGDLRTLRLVARDVDAMIIALSPHEREGLEAILRDRIGVNKDAERSELKRQVAEIIRRGSIASEKERRRLEDYAEMLEAIDADHAEIAAVRRLLSSC